MQTKINAGAYRHETRLGPLFLETQLDEPTVELIVLEMFRRHLTPFDIHSATIHDGIVDFDLREPLTQ